MLPATPGEWFKSTDCSVVEYTETVVAGLNKQSVFHVKALKLDKQNHLRRS